MPLDASIYARFAPKSVADFDKEAYDAEGAKQNVGLNALKLLQGQRADQEGQRKLGEQDALTRIVQANAGGPLQKLIDAARASGTRTGTDYADTLEKGMLQRKETEAKAASENATAAKTLHGVVNDSLKFAYTNPTPQGAEAAIRNAEAMTGQDLSRYRQEVSGFTTPDQFKAWAAGHAMDIATQLPKTQTVDAGNARVNQAIDPLTGKVTETGRTAIAQSPDNAATNARVAAEGAANRGVTMRGQNLTDARTREGTAAAMSKPFEVTGPDGNPLLVQQDKQGNITPVEGYTPKGGTSKPLPNAVLKQITEARDNATTIDRLTSSFKPDFAGKGVLGMGSELQLGVSGNMGVDKDAVDWWKNYRKQAELVERHALFGAALTPGEQASWRSADIGPGMDPSVIERNLKTRSELANKVLDNTRQDLVDAGHSDKRINAIAGRTARTTGAAPAPAVTGGGFKIISVK